MIFLSYWFVVFAVAFFPAYYLAWRPRLRLVVLAAACVVFHGWFAGPAGVLPIVVLGVCTYLFGLSRQRHLCVLGMALSAAALVFYKYTHFVAQSLLAAIPAAGSFVAATAEPLLPGSPPLAISFFVFEFVHYLFEVRRGGEPIRNPLHFGLFAIFWPSLVAGPIKRYRQYVPSLLEGVACVGPADTVAGLLRVASGMLKKAAADNLTLWIESQTPLYDSMSVPMRWAFLVFLAFRIYLDFSGYSDIAIGYARMMGVRLLENFNWPYAARSIDEFWTRWHISLSSWIRDYIYIPLGGSRAGLGRKIVNGLLAFAICGLWHGAAWNFALWGLYHGAGLAVSSNYVGVLGRPGQRLSAGIARVPGLSWVLTLFFVCAGWLLFFFPAPVAWKMFVLLFQP
ncbi:MAG: MBOAT family O-acyltransferase [Chloroflexota bacterium]